MGFDITSYLMGKAAGGGGGGGGGSDPIERWDFTGANPLIGKLRGWELTSSNVSFGASGAIFDGGASVIDITDLSKLPLAFELEVGSMDLTAGANRRLLVTKPSLGCGFIYRSTGVWGVYRNSGGYGAWEDSTETDGKAFSNSKLKILIDTSRKLHIYKDDVLWWEPTNAVNFGDEKITIGSSSYAITNSVIKSFTLR